MVRHAAVIGEPTMVKLLGALPVVAGFCRRLDIAGIIDRACPIRDLAALSHGQVIEVLIANRLTSPRPLVHVADWARSWAVGEVFGADPEVLNDDRIGRALDALAPVLDQVIGSVGLAAIAAFGIDVSRLHWDMTSISLFGAYPDVDEDFAAPRFGHPKDRRVDLKQIQTGLAVTGDGAVPILAKVYDGGAAEVSQVVGAMEALRTLSGERRLLMVGDSKLVSYPNLNAMINAGVDFIAPASKSYVPASILALCEFTDPTVVEYLADRDSTKRPEDRGSYRVSEDTMTIVGRHKRDKPLTLRRIFVHSSARAGAAKTARTKKLDRARGDLERLVRGLGSRHYPTVAAVTDRIAAISRRRRVGPYLRTQIGEDQAGKPTLSWHCDQAALDTEAATDGWYALLTNLNPEQADAAEVLRRYKGQEAVERRYGAFKGPLAVAPLFLQSNRRIHALLGVICLALLTFSLVERQVRQAIAPATKLDGLWAHRPAKPTGRLIFAALNDLRLHPARGPDPPVIPRPAPLPSRLLELLNIDPTQPR
ncbi:MAG: IS1634 family transposase [Dermatophilaceae bacterium]